MTSIQFSYRGTELDYPDIDGYHYSPDCKLVLQLGEGYALDFAEFTQADVENFAVTF